MLLPLLFMSLAFEHATTDKISGIVTDSNGNPIAGISIVVKGTTIATISGTDGHYTINVPDKKNSILVFSGVGYVAKEVKVNGRTTMNVKLSFTVQALKEKPVSFHRMDRKMSVEANAEILGGTPGAAPSIGYHPSFHKRDYDGLIDDFNTEDYDHINENKFLKAKDNPVSTFSIDVDAASYSNIRRILNQGQLPPAGAVRIEEMINYFKYDYPQPKNGQPFSINTEISTAPWNKDHKLVLIGLQGRKIPNESLPASNLVFLIDVSGSMMSPNKLPLVKASLKMLVDQLRQQDRVAIVVYAGAAGLVLKPTGGEEKTTIKDAIDNLEAGGSTAGGAGIRLAYKVAKENFVKGGNNRVILCTDGDFNVGESSDDAMERLIEEERKSGVFLSVLGYGVGNYKDNKMQKLADKGNGNHAYIDGISEAKKVLVNEFGGTLFTIAKDVKLQVEFNPAKVQGYRLIGYENRMLAREDFNDDKKDAGELGSGHTVTAMYEVIPAGIKTDLLKDVDPLKYQGKSSSPGKSSHTDEILTVKFRYKAPDGDVSKLIEQPLKDNQIPLDKTSDNFRFATAVAEFGLLLRNSEFKSAASYDHVIKSARSARGKDEEGYRAEFVRLVESASMLAKSKPAAKDGSERSTAVGPVDKTKRAPQR